MKCKKRIEEKDVKELIEGTKLLTKVLEQLISQKSIGKMVFDIGELNDGFIKTGCAIANIEKK